MVYLAWLALNVALSIGCLWVLARTLRLVRQRQGLGAAVLLGLVLLACGGRSGSSAEVPPSAPTKKVYEGAATVAKTAQVVTIDHQPTYTAQPYLLKGQAPGDTVGSVQVVPTLVGFYGGQQHQWLGGDYALANHQLRYHTYALVTWKLLGIKVYTQLREYRGVVAVG